MYLYLYLHITVYILYCIYIYMICYVYVYIDMYVYIITILIIMTITGNNNVNNDNNSTDMYIYIYIYRSKVAFNIEHMKPTAAKTPNPGGWSQCHRRGPRGMAVKTRLFSSLWESKCHNLPWKMVQCFIMFHYTDNHHIYKT